MQSVLSRYISGNILILSLERVDLRSSLCFPIKVLYDLFSSHMPFEWCIFLSHVMWRVYKYLPSSVNYEAPLDLIFFTDSCYSLSLCVDQCLATLTLLCLLSFCYFLLLPLACVDQSFFFYFPSLLSTSFLLLPLSFIDQSLILLPLSCVDRPPVTSSLLLTNFLLLPQSCVDMSLVTSCLFYRLASCSSSLLLRPAFCYVLSSTDHLPVTSTVLCRHVSCYLLSLVSTSLLFFLFLLSTSPLLLSLFCVRISPVTSLLNVNSHEHFCEVSCNHKRFLSRFHVTILLVIESSALLGYCALQQQNIAKFRISYVFFPPETLGYVE